VPVYKAWEGGEGGLVVVSEVSCDLEGGLRLALRLLVAVDRNWEEADELQEEG
jgi:hypothetical protein